ncbi:MAG: FAD-dependent oxidoreductase [Cyanobacteria bacterium REEB446]|nr:FAD-dependent oxidoreductase [Cyanobacteria bacterium REEB446]
MDNYHFLNSTRKDPLKASAEERINNFNEIYSNFNTETSIDQASRCIDCGVPYCKWSCPVVNHIPEWLKLIAKGEIIKAAELSNETNSLPEICGRVCPQDRLCEGACTLNSGYGAVSIGNIEKYISDTAFAQGWQPKKTSIWHKDKLVSIIGAGPAGLAAADFLTRSGIPVKVYDKYPEIGGLLTYGIPNFKLEKDIVLRRRKILENQGVEFILNTEIGNTIDFKEIEANSSAVFLALGTYKALTGSLDIKKNTAVYMALEYLIDRINLQQSLNMTADKRTSSRLRRTNDRSVLQVHEDHEDDENAEIEVWQQSCIPSLKNKDVVILGGGDTAMDCCRTAIREGAKSVKCLYRRDFQNTPGSRREIENAIEEGVEFIWNTQVLDINENNQGLSLKTVETELKKEFNSKRLIPVLKTGSEKTLNADTVIIAYGFNPSPAQWLKENSIDTDDSGRVLVSKNAENIMQTSNPKVFAGGDMVRGSDLVVTAIFEGRTAAESIKRYIM